MIARLQAKPVMITKGLDNNDIELTYLKVDELGQTKI
jgi:hypothetical protein